jgi:hypothetical protein
MMHSSGCMGIEMTPIAIASRCFTGYKYSFRLAPLSIQHFFTFSSRVFSLPLHLFTMEEKRDIKRSCSSESGSLSSSSGASTPLPSPPKSLSPLVSLPDVSLRRPPSLVREHDGPFEGIPIVDLSSEEEEGLPDISCDEEFIWRLFDELNHELLGLPGDDNFVILNDSDEEEETRKEITTDAETAPPSAVNSPALTVSVSNIDVAPDGVQDDSNDGGDKAGSP